MNYPKSCHFLLLALCCAYGCAKPGDATLTPGAGHGGPGAALIYVGNVIKKEVTPKTLVVGTLVARRTSIVASGAEGKVDQLLVREGDFIEQGAELSILTMVTTNLGIEEAERVLQEREQMALEMRNGSRPEEITQAQAQLEVAKVTMESAKKKWDRLDRLRSSNAVNQDDLDDARERALAAIQTFEAAQANFELVKQGPRDEEVAQAQARYDAQVKQVAYLNAEKSKRTTTAPFNGTVVQEHTEDGEWLSKGDPVVTIANLDEVQLIANVDQLEIDNVRLGSEVDVTIDAAAKKTWKGTVEAIIPRSDWQSGSRTFPVKVTIKNEFFESGDRRLPLLTEGMYARVSFTGEQRTALLVPKNAVIRSESGSRVVAVIPGEGENTGKAKPVLIIEGSAFDDYVEVKSGDLQEGTQVVTEGAERLSPFADVLITTPEASEIPVAKPNTNQTGTEQPQSENIDSTPKESDVQGKEEG